MLCSPLAVLTPKLAAAKGEQGIYRFTEYLPFPFSAPKFACALRGSSICLFAAGIGLRAFYGLSGQCRLMLSAY